MSKLRVFITAEDSGDCEYGCWNTGYGVEVTKDGELIYEQGAWASCLDCSSVDWQALFEVIREEQNKGDVTLDLGKDPEEEYPQWFLEALM